MNMLPSSWIVLSKLPPCLRRWVWKRTISLQPDKFCLLQDQSEALVAHSVRHAMIVMGGDVVSFVVREGSWPRAGWRSDCPRHVLSSQTDTNMRNKAHAGQQKFCERCELIGERACQAPRGNARCAS